MGQYFVFYTCWLLLFGQLLFWKCSFAQKNSQKAQDKQPSLDPSKHSFRMSKIARQHLSDEKNPNNFPKLLGVDFPGCKAHTLYDQESDLTKLVKSFGTDYDTTTIQELSQGFQILGMCHPEQSFEVFDAIVQTFPGALFGYIGRGISAVRLAKIKASSESAMKDFAHVIKQKPNFYLPYRCRAELHYLTGNYEDALKDAEKDLHFKHDGSAYVMAGIISYKLEKDNQAVQYLKMAQKFVNGNNAISYEYLGLSYLNMGMLRNAVDALKNSLEYEGENLNVWQTIGTIYSELGDPALAHVFLDKALAMKADDTKTLELKGHVYFSNGHPKEAVKWYQSCMRNDPTQTSCMFMRAVSYASIGQFYKAVKVMTRVMLSSTCNQEYKEPLYLRDFYRYLNHRLDTPLVTYRFDEDLPENYRFIWARKVLPNHFNYTEQPGIEPHIIDVEDVSFQELPNDTKILLCKARDLSDLLQYRADGFMPNTRSNKAMALAALDVAQTIQSYWNNPKTKKGWKGRSFSWRDIFEVAVKWRKLVSMDQPVIWLDQLPKQIVDAGFITHMIMKKGYVEMPRYSSYTVEALQLAKFMIRSLLGQKLPAKAQDLVMKAVSPTDILHILRKYDGANQNGAFTVGMQVPSSRSKGALLNSVMLSIVGENEEDITLSIQSARTSQQIFQYHAELSHVFNELRDDVIKKKSRNSGKDNDVATTNLVLQLVYYFYNLLPLSRGTSAISYSVAMGMFLAIDKELTSRIPVEKQPDIEAYFAGSSEAFIKKIRSWLKFKNAQVSISKYPDVTSTFYSSRTVLEALNADFTEEQCKPYRLHQ
ncbi:tetratricopeptide repeat protein 13-like [Clytia hemisphaerica]|uniref:tetratricopeptide repeat protein 13-like n=1 Tax=Clytia hemisphaerica TaxID=252671 RepID=UPI0034D7A3AE